MAGLMTRDECEVLLATLPRYGLTYRIVSMGVVEVLDIRPIPGGQFVLVTDLQAALTGEDQAPLSVNLGGRPAKAEKAS